MAHEGHTGGVTEELEADEFAHDLGACEKVGRWG